MVIIIVKCLVFVLLVQSFLVFFVSESALTDDEKCYETTCNSSLVFTTMSAAVG